MYQLSRFLSLFFMAIAIAASQIVDCLDAGQQISLNFKNGMNEAKDHCLQLGYEIYREWAVPGVEKSPNSIDIIGLLFSSYETNRSNFKSLNDDSLIEILDQYGSICSDLIHSVERKNSLIRRDPLNSALEQHVNKQSGQIDEDRVDELIGSPGISDNLDNIEPINKIDEQSTNASELIHEEPEIINGDQPVETEEPAESLPIETPQTEKQSDFHEQVIDEDSNKATELSPDITKEKVVEKPKESLMQNLMHIATSKKSAESKPSDESSPVIDENKTAKLNTEQKTSNTNEETKPEKPTGDGDPRTIEQRMGKKLYKPSSFMTVIGMFNQGIPSSITRSEYLNKYNEMNS